MARARCAHCCDYVFSWSCAYHREIALAIYQRLIADIFMIKLLQSGPIAGVFWMIVTGILFVFVTALVKYLGTDIPAVQAAFMRYALGVVLLVPLIGETLRTRFTREMWKVLIWRGVFHCFGVSLWFYAMARIPIADVTAMNYLSPIYVTLGAALFLGERLALRRIAAVTIALIGAIIILRPGFREIGDGHPMLLLQSLADLIFVETASDMVAPSVVVLMLSLTADWIISVAIGVWMPLMCGMSSCFLLWRSCCWDTTR